MKVFSLYVFIFYMILSTGCNNKSKEHKIAPTADSTITTNTEQNTTLNLMEDDAPPMSGWKCYGLYGRVKSVKYTTGNCIEFNTDGNWTKRTIIYDGTEEHTEDRIYQSLIEYIVEEGEYKTKYEIEYCKNARIEKVFGENIDTPETAYQRFLFDKQKRLAKFEDVYMSTFSEEYKYTNDTSPFPASMVSEGGNCSSSYTTIHNYKYSATDNKGNWTERTIDIKEYEIDEEGKKSLKTSSITEKREITYF